MAAEGTKSREQGSKYTYKHLFIRTCARACTYKGFLSGGGWRVEWRLHSLLIPSLLAPEPLSTRTSCICKVAFPKEGFDQRNLLSWDQEGWVQVNPFYIVKHRLASRIRVPPVNCLAVKQGMRRLLWALVPPRTTGTLNNFLALIYFGTQP